MFVRVLAGLSGSESRIWKGLPWQVLRLAEEEKVQIWATLSMLEELETVSENPPTFWLELQPRSSMVTLSMRSPGSVAAAGSRGVICSSKSIPSMTLPKTECLSSRCGVAS